MKITILGLSITSSWGNGHATTYRALARALHARGHRIIFFERDLEWYASNRDMPEPPFCSVHIYERWDEVIPKVRRELASSDVAIVGSYFPDALAAIEEVFDSHAGVKAFYDIDTPITVAALEAGEAEYLKPEQVAGFDIYFSFTGGPMLRKLEREFGAQKAVPLYCSFDPGNNQFSMPQGRFASDLSYMGTYAADRQPQLEELFCKPARTLHDKKFLIAGPQYPSEIEWPANVRQIIHLEPRLHAPFYCSSRLTLNLTRHEMVSAGYSPSVRLFEAAGRGATIVSDRWPGLETFFTPGEEILLPDSGQDVVGYLTGMYETEMKAIGWRAQERVLLEHTSERRAIEFEEYVGGAEASAVNTAAVAETSL
ncbi:MAG TPA: glycosyltransferase [Terriglobales bacterium]|nr:glycosyltransferase [Terriglobales bacterium]